MSDRIAVVCGECTGKLAVPLTAAGKKIRCPRCSSVVSVPAAQPAPAPPAPSASPGTETVRKARRVSADESPAPAKAAAEAKPRPKQKPKPAQAAEDSWDTGGLPSYGEGNDAWDSYDEPDNASALPPRAKRGDRQATRSTTRAVAGSEGSKATRGPVLIGILMMVGAFVWFFGGLAVGIIFYYPPVLFVLGLISFCKGMFGSSSN